MKNINIPEPCSENWNEMSPTEKGAFCQKCAIDVYDFTNKSGDEIRDILTLNIGGRVCGRIEPRQLDELNADFLAWKMNNKQSFNRAWIFTLLVVFGMTLFSCEEDEVPVVQELQRTAQAFLSEIPEKIEASKLEAIKSVESTPEKDDLKKRQSHVSNRTEEIPEIDYIPEMLGEVVLEEIPEPEVQEVIKGEMRTVTHIAGGMSWSTAYAESLVEPVTCEVEMSGLVYPNPAKNLTTLKVTMPNDGDVDIRLFSMNGQNIRTLHAGRIQKGDTEYPIDLSELETGMYLVVLVSNGKKETIRFSKI